jgi:hypothetical protein
MDRRRTDHHSFADGVAEFSNRRAFSDTCIGIFRMMINSLITRMNHVRQSTVGGQSTVGRQWRHSRVLLR